MSEQATSATTHCLSTGDLFAWRAAGIDVVLFGEWTGVGLVVSRAWVGHDRLTDIRRWTFESPVAFAGQVRRLVTDATQSPHAANEAMLAALSWAEASVR